MLSNRRPMTEPEFAAFLQARENRWELFNGQPVMMAPTTQRHADIVANTLASLHRQLRGTGYRATCSSTGVRVGAGTIRYPDLVVDRGPRVDLAMYATAPALVIEILSPARDPFDMHLRLLEYRAVPDIACILLIDPEAPRAIIHRRDDPGWRDRICAGADQVVEISEIGAVLALGDVYAGLELSHRVDGIRGSRC